MSKSLPTDNAVELPTPVSGYHNSHHVLNFPQATTTPPPPSPQPTSTVQPGRLADLQEHVEAIAAEARDLVQPGLPGKLGDSDHYSFYRKLLAESEIKLTDQIQEPTVCLHVTENEQSIPFGTLGNFSLIVGKAKSRKTYLLSVLIAALIKGEKVMNVSGRLPQQQQNVIYFDTEQHKGHVMRVLKRIANLVGSDEVNGLRVYHLKKYPVEHRLNAIRVAIEQAAGLGAIIIDGIRDTVFDINDAKEATERATDLLQWTEEKNAHLITVIHENKGNSNARGHLGSELVNKAETVISVARDAADKNVSVVTPEYCRDKEFEPFGFSIDESGLPYLIDDLPASNEGSGRQSAGRSRKPTVDTLKPDQIQTLVNRVFVSDESLRYGQLLTGIIEASEFMGVPLAKSRAETFIARVTKSGYLVKKKTPTQRYESYQLNTANLPTVHQSP